MADHGKILGGLFVAWGIVQGVGSMALVALSKEPVQWPGLLLFFGVILLAAYAAVGIRLWKGDSTMRVPAIVLSVLALISFPVGTAIGIYGLFALFARRPAQVAS